jgi:hypothetical protein
VIGSGTNTGFMRGMQVGCRNRLQRGFRTINDNSFLTKSEKDDDVGGIKSSCKANLQTALPGEFASAYRMSQIAGNICSSR